MILLVVLCASCGRKPDTLVEGGYDEQEMSGDHPARREVDAFLAALNARNGSDFAVKVPGEDQGEIEHFWLVDVSYQAGSGSIRYLTVRWDGA